MDTARIVSRRQIDIGMDYVPNRTQWAAVASQWIFVPKPRIVSRATLIVDLAGYPAVPLLMISGKFPVVIGTAWGAPCDEAAKLCPT